MGAKVLVLFLVAYYMTAGVRKAWLAGQLGQPGQAG